MYLHVLEMHMFFHDRLVVEYSRQPQYSTQVTQEVIVFLYKTYEESVIPPVLVHMITTYMYQFQT